VNSGCTATKVPGAASRGHEIQGAALFFASFSGEILAALED
jgi:hypothetical protein